MINNIELFRKYEKQALDINASVWISASAGGGKTTLIIKRILKILIFSSIKMLDRSTENQRFSYDLLRIPAGDSHVEHSKIFAITYTNEAANEIKKRIKEKLLQWKENEEILNQDLEFFEITNHFNDYEIKQIKTNCKNFFDKKVFNLINISTFHSFCFDILKQFQNELDLNLDKFHLMEEESTKILLENEIKKILITENITNYHYEYILDIALSIIKYQNEINCSTWNNLNSNLKNIIDTNVPRGTFSYEINKEVKDVRRCSTWNIRLKKFKFFVKKKFSARSTENRKLPYDPLQQLTEPFHVEQFKRYLYQKKNIKNMLMEKEMFHVEHSLTKLIKRLKAQELVPRGTNSYKINSFCNVPRGTFIQKKSKILNETNCQIAKRKITDFPMISCNSSLKCSTWNNLKQNFDKIIFYKKYLYRKFNIRNNHHLNKIENVPRGTFSCEINNLDQCSTWNNLTIDEIKKIDIKIAEQLNKVYKKLLNDQNIKQIFNEYLEIFLTKNLTPRINLSKKEIFQKEQNELMFHMEQFSTIENINNSKIIFNIIKNSFQNIAKYKKQNNFLDFNDIINHTFFLLENNKNKNYILYSLSNKIHHLIVDESQDNSQKQWNIIKILFENLFLEKHKNIFIVGDVKQSIYKFQGAEPQYFNLMKMFFQNKAQEWEKKFYFIEWNFSFRMSQAISTDVDSFFNSNSFSKYLTSQENFTLKHIPFVKNEKENVPCGTNHCEINNLNQCSTWNISENSNIDNIQKILNIVDKKRAHESIMILFRSRNHTMRELIERLQQKQIPIKYNFYENLFENNTTKIILLINEILINCSTSNNLNLNLKDEIQENVPRGTFSYEINNLDQCSTWNILQIKFLSKLLNEQDEQKIQNLLLKLLNILKKYSYDLILKIIINCFYQSLDKQITAKLLEIAKKLKNQNLPSIQNFNHYIYKNKIEVLLKNKNESKITISTVHGAKGLEADIVIIADDILKHKIHEKFYFNFEKKTFILLNNKNCFHIDFFKNQIHDEEYEENMRLLYVAMTRAKKELITLNNVSHENPQ